MRHLLLFLALAGCSNASSEAPVTPTDTLTASVSDSDRPTPEEMKESARSSEAMRARDWEGAYTFTEGSGTYTYEYGLVLGSEASGYAGTFSRVGPQETRFYDVRGEETEAGGLTIILTSFGDENVHTIPEIGETLFLLRWEDSGDEAGDRTLMTYWSALGPTGVEESTEAEKMIAFSPASGE